MSVAASSFERSIPIVLFAQALCLPCLFGMVYAMPVVGVVTLVSYLVVFVLLGLTAGLELRLGASVWVAIAFGAIAVAALLRACAVGELPKTVGVPLAGSLTLSTALLTVVHLRRRRLPNVCCPVCGYDLRAAEGDTCPECGSRERREMA